MNVYNYVDMNYLHEPELQNLLPNDMLTDFLQRQAWTGLSDDQLRVIWRDIYAYILANLQTGQMVFQNRNLSAVKNIVAWLNSYALDFTFTPESLKSFLHNVQMLHDYLIKEKYILNTYINFPDTYSEFIGADGSINITNSDNKVLHIDFSGKRLKETAFEPLSMVSSKQLIYIREHIMDFSAKVFEVLSYYKYTLTSEKLFSMYEIYWNRFAEAKVADTDIEYDTDMLEQLVLTNPNNILTFAEYIVFGAYFVQGKDHIINKLISKNRANAGFVSFLQHYRNSRIMFFRITNNADDEGTIIKDILTSEFICLEDVDISRYSSNELFIAYFNPQNKLLPSVTISLELDEMQVLAFQDTIKKICRYMLGETASIYEFLDKYDLLARYLCVASAQNKRLGVILKSLMPPSTETVPLYSESMDSVLEERFLKITADFYFTDCEKEKLLQVWRTLYTRLADEPDFAQNAGIYLLSSIKIFLDLNYPDDLVEGMLAVFEIDKKVLHRYAAKASQLIELEKNKMSYLTEFGMIKFIDSLFNKE